MAVRQNLINKRTELGLKQREVATKAGIKRSSYAAIERGLRTPKLETAQRICDVLKISVSEAFPIPDEKQN